MSPDYLFSSTGDGRGYWYVASRDSEWYVIQPFASGCRSFPWNALTSVDVSATLSETLLVGEFDPEIMYGLDELIAERWLFCRDLPADVYQDVHSLVRETYL